MLRRIQGIGMAALIVSVGAGGQALAGLTENLFFNDVNRIIGDPRRGTNEDYFNTSAVTPEYLSPNNIINIVSPIVVGSQPGHVASQRLGLGGSVGINIAQPFDVSGSPTDIRTAYTNNFYPDITAANGGTPLPIWAARTGVAMQGQTNQDGSSNLLNPTGSVSIKLEGLTPILPSGLALGINGDDSLDVISSEDDGLAFGSAVDGIQDFVPWKLVPGDPTRVATGFDLDVLDPTNIASFAALNEILDSAGGALVGPTLDAAIAALSGRISVYENGALYDQVLGSHNEDNFDHNSPGTNGFPGDELNDAVDGSLVLTGVVENVNIELRWSADLLVTDAGPDGSLGTRDDLFSADRATVSRTMSVTGNITYDGGMYFLDGLLDSNSGAFAMHWADTAFSNTTGTDGDTVYDFIEGINPNAVFSGDVVFQLGGGAIPEPITATLGLMGLGVLGMATRRRVA